LVAPLVAMAVAQNAPQIKIWNPSDYNEDDNESPIFVSDFATGDDEADDVKENTYRLMATSKNTPDPALVEFELQLTSVNTVTIGTATQVAADAWEYHWDISGIPDGNYTLRAILYSGAGLTASEVDRDEIQVVIRSGNPAPETRAEAADITYPLNGAATGFYTDPTNGATNTVLTVEYSRDTTFIEAFYTVSDPGDEPEWKNCAGPFFVNISGDAPPGSVSVRCVLESADQGGQSVTGLAVVANNSPNEDPIFGNFGASSDPNLDQAGDAIRVLPYKQDATSMTIDDAEVRVDGDLSSSSSCSPAQFVTVFDQFGNPIAGMNVDVHSRGPSDQLKYNTGGLFFGAPSRNKSPDKAHSGSEVAFSCRERQSFAGTQGDHNVPGAPDVKHIESRSAQTSNVGRFGIQLKSDINGGTLITFFADEDDDDQFCDDEPFVAGSIGWNVPAPPAVAETPVVSECPVPEPAPAGGPETSTGPSPSDTGGGTDECTHTGTSGDDNIVGTQGNDIICAGAGDDSVDGRGGDDIIRGEDGDDFIDGDFGEDTIDGGAGNDRIDGGLDNDVIDGRDGVDVLVAGGGNDTLRGGKAVDGLQGGPGNDLIQAGSADDVVDAQGGKDVLRGSNGEDILRGGGGADTIRGMKQDDQLTGGGGNDKLDGGQGRDQCSGGGGRDRMKRCER